MYIFTYIFWTFDVSLIDDNFLTSVYRKPTFTGLCLNYFSAVPLIFKLNSIKTLSILAYVVFGNYKLLPPKSKSSENIFKTIYICYIL